MRHEHIVKRDNGDKFKITVDVYIESFIRKGNSPANYQIQVEHLPKGKKKWLSVFTESYKWRCLSLEERKEHEMGLYLSFVSAEEILQAKTELWQMLKPD